MATDPLTDTTRQEESRAWPTWKNLLGIAACLLLASGFAFVAVPELGLIVLGLAVVFLHAGLVGMAVNGKR